MSITKTAESRACRGPSDASDGMCRALTESPLRMETRQLGMRGCEFPMLLVLLFSQLGRHLDWEATEPLSISVAFSNLQYLRYQVAATPLHPWGGPSSRQLLLKCKCLPVNLPPSAAWYRRMGPATLRYCLLCPRTQDCGHSQVGSTGSTAGPRTI